jgi:hypothetical protein
MGHKRMKLNPENKWRVETTIRFRMWATQPTITRLKQAVGLITPNLESASRPKASHFSFHQTNRVPPFGAE